MSEFGGGEGGEGKDRPNLFWRIFNPTLWRKGREADLTGIPTEKLVKAAKERGVQIDFTEFEPGKKAKGIVNKAAVKGDDWEEFS